jgi:hypothetical protein
MPAIEMAEAADFLAVDVDVVGVVDEPRDEEREGLCAGGRLEAESIPGVAGIGGWPWLWRPGSSGDWAAWKAVRLGCLGSRV